MKNESWNWSDLRVFLAVIREGSTLAASRKLGMAQPTVARRIEVLEHETGLTLFERHTRGFTPTQNGRNLVPKAEAVEAAALRFCESVAGLAQARPIRITAYSANFSPRMIEIVNAFSAENPDIAFEFLPTHQVLDLLQGEADIALRLVRNEPAPELICRKISDARWTLYGGREYARQFGLPKSTADLSGHRFVTYQRKGSPNILHEWLLRHVAPEQIVASYSELELMLAAVRSGKGLGVSNLKLVGSDETLVPCFDEIEDLTVPHLILISPEAYRRPEVKAFIAYFAPRYAAIYNK